MLSLGLRHFLAVAQTGSMREASQQLNVAQSAISRQVRNLEQDLRVTLFERSARGVRLTSAGEILLHHAREAANRMEQLQGDLEAVRGNRRGHVVARVIESFAAAQLPDVLSQFHAQYPAVTLDITVARTNSIADLVREGSCHFGVTFNHTPDPRLTVLAYRGEPLQLLVAPGHPLARRRGIRLEDALAFPVAAPSLRGASRQLFDEALRASGQTCRPVLETNSMHVIAGFLRSSGGVAIGSVSRAQPYLDFGVLVTVPVENPIFARGRLELLVRRNQRLPPAADALARAVARRLAA
jgi:DNA-binding transcriptional LysR family regulator